LYDPEKIKTPLYKEDDLDDLPPLIKRRKINRKRQHHDRLVALDGGEPAIHGYLAAVSYADAMLGRVLKALKQSSHADNTVVVLWSDHGFHHGEKGDWGKHTLWERTSNVPFIWSGPGVAKGKRINATVSLIDMYPTFVEMGSLPAFEGVVGLSLTGMLLTPSRATDCNVFLPYLDPGGYAIINQKWRYIHYSDGTEELYDVRNDPHEWDNLAEDMKWAPVKQNLKASAPKSFAPVGISRNRLKLIKEGEKYRWEIKKRPPRKK
jgi:arylsulfatase A-like enzyme